MNYFKSLFTVLLLLCIVCCFGQTDKRESRHIFNYPIELNQCEFDGTTISPENKQVMEKGWIFSVINKVDANYIIQVSRFTKKNDKAKAQNLKTFQTKNYENIYFELSSLQYLAFAKELKKRGGFVVGASTTLIKIRPGNGKNEESEVIYPEFGNDFNIGVTAGWRIFNKKRDISISLVGGIAFSSIKVTPQTTRNFIDSESTQSSITFSGGSIFEIQKFQISAFVGIDAMSGEIGKHWIYRNRPWIGLGFGYEIFKGRGSLDNKRP
jgi:hypothetical protein